MPVLVILTTDTSSASEDEDCLQRPGRLASAPLQSHAGVAPWLDQAVQGSPASSAASCTSSHPGGRPAAVPSAAAVPAGPAALARVGRYSRKGPLQAGEPPRPARPTFSFSYGKCPFSNKSGS